MRSAKELCAMLITRGIKTLSEDEEDVVIDYLDDIGIETLIDDSPKELCMKLLETTMMKDMGRRVPISAYANSLVEKEQEAKVAKKLVRSERETKTKRRNLEMVLSNKKLPGCVPDQSGIFNKTLYTFITNPEVGIAQLSDNTLQYNAEVSINRQLYEKVFLNVPNPILELTTTFGNKGYARITSVHNESPDIIYISPLVGTILNTDSAKQGYVKLCVDIPRVSKVDFTYYGDQKSLDEILDQLITKLPSVINAFSYLSLGMLLKTTVNDQEVIVRVDKLHDLDDDPIFVGIIPVGESDIPFEIEPDN